MKDEATVNPRRVRDPGRTRRDLIASATGLFSARGFDGVSVDDIVAAAGVNKRMVYHYFQNKEGLYLAVLCAVFRRLSDLELEALESATDPVEAIAGILEAYFAFLGKNPEFVALLSWENLYQGRFVSKHPELLSKNPALTRLRKAVKDGVRRGIFRDNIDVKHLLVSLISLCFVYHANRYTLSRSVGLNLESPEVLRKGLAHVTDLTLNGLCRRKM